LEADDKLIATAQICPGSNDTNAPMREAHKYAITLSSREFEPEAATK